jgi:hypothetical protein
MFCPRGGASLLLLFIDFLRHSRRLSQSVITGFPRVDIAGRLDKYSLVTFGQAE